MFFAFIKTHKKVKFMGPSSKNFGEIFDWRGSFKSFNGARKGLLWSNIIIMMQLFSSRLIKKKNIIQGKMSQDGVKESKVVFMCTHYSPNLQMYGKVLNWGLLRWNKGPNSEIWSQNLNSISCSSDSSTLAGGSWWNVGSSVYSTKVCLHSTNVSIILGCLD